MRFAAYAGTSMVLASGVIVRAMHERSNLYSACVYLAQSNACLMVLTNVALLGVCTAMLGLQRLFYGPLRPIEVEQLYEKAWFAITETCLAMTIFREEVGGWFLVMFVCLLIGKVWSWIGEGRVEILEQQPPSNPRLFHARLSVSLVISTLFNVLMLRYSIHTVLHHARPNMMVMFAFEFAVLTISSISTGARYIISLYEARVIRLQIQERRAELRRDRESSSPQIVSTDNIASPEILNRSVMTETDIDASDIDVPGWEEKGRWVFYLDLVTDFCKLILYLTFFCVLCMFYGMPIHIIRDVALTIRSFYKRITDFVRYRQATRDMHAKYPDATAVEIAREDVCIICREDMKPWGQPVTADPQRSENAPGQPSSIALDERLRPKKLPCGHILHFACLRSWLERQQNCPTCRRPVLVAGGGRHQQEGEVLNQHDHGHGHNNHPQARLPHHGQQPALAQNVFNLGPLRIAFGVRQGLPNPQLQENNHALPPTLPGPAPVAEQAPRSTNTPDFQRQTLGTPNRTIANIGPVNVQLQLQQAEQQLLREINGLRLQQSQLFLVRALQGELARLRAIQPTSELPFGIPASNNTQIRPGEVASSHPAQIGQGIFFGSQQQPLSSDHPNLPTGMTLPPGWTVLPLERMLDPVNVVTSEANVPDVSTSQPTSNTLTPSPHRQSTDAASIDDQMVSQARPQRQGGSATLLGDETQNSSIDHHAAASSSAQRSMSVTKLQDQQEPGDQEGMLKPSEVGSIKSPEAAASLWKHGEERPGPYRQSVEDGSNSYLESADKGGATSMTADGPPGQSLTGPAPTKGKGKAPTVEDYTDEAE